MLTDEQVQQLRQRITLMRENNQYIADHPTASRDKRFSAIAQDAAYGNIMLMLDALEHRTP